MRERTTVWVLEHTIDGYYTPQAYFGTEVEAHTVLSQLGKHGIAGWRVSEEHVWMEAKFFLEEDTSHIAKWLRVHMDPEFAEFQRLEAKFKEVWK